MDPQTEQQTEAHTNGISTPTVEAPVTSVDIPPPDEDDGIEAVQEQRQTRADKKRERLALREEAERSRQENETLRAELQRIREEQAEMRGRLEAQAKPATNPREAKIDELEGRMTSVLAMVQEGKADMREFYKIQREIMRLEAEDVATSRPSLSDEDLDRRVERTSLEREFPWLSTNAKARQWASGAVDQMVADGAPNNYETKRAALAQAAAKYGLGGAKSAPVSESRQRAYTGVPARESGSGNAGVRVQLDERGRALAKARFPNMSEDEAVAQLANLHAKKAKERGEY